PRWRARVRAGRSARLSRYSPRPSAGGRGFAAGPARRRRSELSSSRDGDGEEHLERRAPFPGPIHPDHAAHFVHRSRDDGEAQTRPPTWLLGGVERLEDLLAIFRPDTGP